MTDGMSETEAKDPDAVGQIDEQEKEHRSELQEEFTSESKKCPECDEPLDNLRKTCSNCGYEFKEGDYDDEEAGAELTAGSLVDDEGNEITDEDALDDQDASDKEPAEG